MYMQIFTNLYYNVFLNGFERYVGLKSGKCEYFNRFKIF